MQWSALPQVWKANQMPILKQLQLPPDKVLRPLLRSFQTWTVKFVVRLYEEIIRSLGTVSVTALTAIYSANRLVNGHVMIIELTNRIVLAAYI